MSICLLCRRERAESSELCRYHLMAKRKVEAAYRRWSEAYGGMTWQDYLEAISKSKETGQWAREVAEMLSKKTDALKE